ncbi:MAG: tRNA-binding protein [Proteobacteria bacterium]|nr:tRNA-binding protein [Pseudomonadota bacterium]
MTIPYDDFAKVNILSGTIIKAEVFERARKPAYKVWADFGPEVGVLQTSAQVTIHYTPSSLIGRQILGVTNLGTKNIAGFESQFLLVGCEDLHGAVCLATLDPKVGNGKRLF